MADEPVAQPSSPSITPGLNRPTNLTPPPTVPQGPSASMPPRPIAPPQGLSVKDTNISNLSPSPAPFSSAPPAPPVAPTPPPTPTPAPQSPQSNPTIRTMAEDLKKPQSPVSNIPKPPPPPPPPSMPLAPGSRQPISIPAPPRTAPVQAPMARVSPSPAGTTPSHTQFRPLQASPAPSVAPIRAPLSSSSVNVPPPTRSKKGLIIFLLLLLIIGGALVWFFFFRGDSGTPAATPTPIVQEPTPIATPIPLDFNALFAPESAISYTTTTSPKLSLSEIDTSISINKPAPGMLRTFLITDGQSTRKSLADLITDLKLNIPKAVVDSLDPEQTYFSLFGLADGKVSRGIMVKVRDSIALPAALTAWESTMSTDLTSIFKLTLSKAASKTFLPNSYQGVPVRYRNFPDQMLTIDYGTIVIPTADSYLVLTNSKDHIFSIIDRAVGTVPGK